jgi:hypothetical protein
MFPIHPSEARIVVAEQTRRLREAATTPTARRRPSTTRRALAASLRCAATRLDPKALAPRAA